MPILRHTSGTGVPDSACLNAKVTCSAEYLLFFMNTCSFLRNFTIFENSHYGWPRFRGADHMIDCIWKTTKGTDNTGMDSSNTGMDMNRFDR